MNTEVSEASVGAVAAARPLAGREALSIQTVAGMRQGRYSEALHHSSFQSKTQMLFLRCSPDILDHTLYIAMRVSLARGMATYEDAMSCRSGMQTLSLPQFFWMLMESRCTGGASWSRMGGSALVRRRCIL